MTLPDDQVEFADQALTIDLEGRPLGARVFRDCTFIDCNFSGANLAGARFVDCTFRGSNFSNAKLTNVKLADVAFQGCKVLGVDFRACDGTLFGASFDETDLSYCVFVGMKLRKAQYTKSKLIECDFTGCDLAGADFSGSNLRGALFSKTILKQADFRSATEYAFDPRLNELKGARFSSPEVVRLLTVFGVVIDK